MVLVVASLLKHSLKQTTRHLARVSCCAMCEEVRRSVTVCRIFTSSMAASISIHSVSATFLAPLQSRALCTISLWMSPSDSLTTLTSLLSHPCTSGYRIWLLRTYRPAWLACPAATAADKLRTLTMASSVASRRLCSDLSRLLSRLRFFRSFWTCSRNFSWDFMSMLNCYGMEQPDEAGKKSQSPRPSIVRTLATSIAGAVKMRLSHVHLVTLARQNTCTV